ncbi:glycosyltransferase family 4 protein [Leifsonia poae]|uniref:D-inositol 3-phosphate glycosyltransferase n=1 Tax=Leifsonia poae TaxID=110933 RepID=A0A9W6H979_9MICO|nr:glycosyl hydrolase [Leifsonia poae]
MSAHPDTPVFFAVPDVIDDPGRVSGGNLYDQRVRDGLRADGWDMRMALVGDDDRQTAAALTALPDGALVLLDGLLLARESAAVADHGARLRLVVLAHMVAGELTDDERAAFRVAQRIIATSGWTRSELIAQDAADPHRIVVAHPGTDAAPVTTVSPSGGRLLCVATVAPHKGQDLLVRALAGFADLEGWTCTIVGSLEAAPDFVAELKDAIAAAGLAERITFTGVLTGAALDEAYRQADLVVLPSRTESYGMAVAEALARGIPVLASGVGGIPEAIARNEGGMIVSPDDPWALAVVLRQWWASADRRRELTAAALTARGAARRWGDTAAIVSAALDAAVTARAAERQAARS